MPELGFSDEFAIELHSLSVSGVGSHYYWVLRDLGKDEVLEVMHGWPVDPKSGRPRLDASVLTSDSRLGFLHGRPPTKPGESRPLENEDRPYIVVDTGFEADMRARWAEGQRIGKFLDRQNISYPRAGIGTNSNSFARTIGNAMGYDVNTIVDPKTGEAVGFAPGNEDLFPRFPNAPLSRFRTGHPKRSGTTVDPRNIDPLTQRPREFSPQDIQQIIRKRRDEEFGDRRGALEDPGLLNSGGGSDRPNLPKGRSTAALAERRRAKPVLRSRKLRAFRPREREQRRGAG